MIRLLPIWIVCAVAHGIAAQPLTVTTLAGPPHERGFEDGPNGMAGFSGPSGLATDSAGNVYVADSRNDVIRKISPTGDVTTLAGLARSSGTANGRGSAARFHTPDDVAVDPAGNAYVISSLSIRKITPDGIVTRLAGPPLALIGSADGTGSGARFNFPRGLTVDPLGNVYVADTDNHTIRKITPSGNVTTLAGLAGNSGNADGTGSAARFHFPRDVAAAGDGNLYVADQANHTIRRITPEGVVTTYAGLAGERGVADGTGSAARFADPLSIAAGPNGTLFVVHENGVRRISAQAEVTTLAGNTYSGATTLTKFRTLAAVAVDGQENVFVADISTIWKVAPDGGTSTLSGWNIGHEDGPARAARFWLPAAVAIDGSGNLYVTDSGNSTIRRISTSGDVTTLAGLAETVGSGDGTGSAARFQYPGGIATDGTGNLYVADSGNNTIRKVTAAGVVTTVAGDPRAPLAVPRDGRGAEARFNSPSGLVADGEGNLYVVDSLYSAIRKIDAAGNVTTLAGGKGIGSEDGIGALARFDSPSGIAIGSDGDLYVTDSYNHTIRRVTPAGEVTTYAGQAGSAGSSDGLGSAARFTYPGAIVRDLSGDLLVSSGTTIRRIRPGGVVTTVAGLPQTCRSRDGTGSDAWFCGAGGMAVDAGGNVVFTDAFYSTIRVGSATIDDAAVIDQASGQTGITRQLGSAPQSATSWQWSLIRRPSGSSAQLSSTSVRDPTFTPDVPDLYVFQLIARGSRGTSVTTVSLQATPGPRRRSIRH